MDEESNVLAVADAEDGASSDGGDRKVKPAIKRNEKLDSKEQRHLKWDEAAIEEHDQLRGTRMKIEEPNTPYTHYDSGAESDDSRRPKSPATQKEGISWEGLQNRLDSIAAVREAFPPSPNESQGDTDNADTDHSDLDDDQRKEMRKLEFKEHRKRHYNEMELVRKFRQEHPDGVVNEIQDTGQDADDENDDD